MQSRSKGLAPMSLMAFAMGLFLTVPAHSRTVTDPGATSQWMDVSESDMPMLEAVENPCTGETVILQGDVHTVGRTFVSLEGRYYFLHHHNTADVIGTVEGSDIVYNVSSMGTHTIKSSTAETPSEPQILTGCPAESTHVHRDLLTAPGEGSFFVLYVFHESINAQCETTATIESISTKCPGAPATR